MLLNSDVTHAATDLALHFAAYKERVTQTHPERLVRVHIGWIYETEGQHYGSKIIMAVALLVLSKAFTMTDDGWITEGPDFPNFLAAIQKDLARNAAA